MHLKPCKCSHHAFACSPSVRTRKPRTAHRHDPISFANTCLQPQGIRKALACNEARQAAFQALMPLSGTCCAKREQAQWCQA